MQDMQETKDEKVNKNDNKKVLLNSLVAYIVYGSISVVLFLLVFLLRKPWEVDDSSYMMQILSDSFVIPGVIILCVFALQLISFWGGFDGLLWGFRFALSSFIPVGPLQKHKSYGDYKLEKMAKRKKAHLEGLVVGAILLILGLIFYLIYLVLTYKMM